MQGIILKYTNVMKGFQARYFIIDKQTAQLNYYVV